MEETRERDLGKTICNQKEECFARICGANGVPRCTILEDAINDYRCPFMKPRREYTDGIRYPLDSEVYNWKLKRRGK